MYEQFRLQIDAPIQPDTSMEHVSEVLHPNKIKVRFVFNIGVMVKINAVIFWVLLII